MTATTYPTREAFLVEATLQLACARHSNPEFDKVFPDRCLELACELADLAEAKGIAPWLTPNTRHDHNPQLHQAQ